MRYRDFLDAQELKTYAQSFNQRARQLGIVTALSLAELQDVVLESGGVCAYCGRSLLEQPFELDHLIPLAERGAHHRENVVVACPECNRKKASQSPLKFALASVAVTHLVTPTIQRILDYYQATPSIQKGLFDDIE